MSAESKPGRPQGAPPALDARKGVGGQFGLADLRTILRGPVPACPPRCRPETPSTCTKPGQPGDVVLCPVQHSDYSAPGLYRNVVLVNMAGMRSRQMRGKWPPSAHVEFQNDPYGKVTFVYALEGRLSRPAGLCFLRAGSRRAHATNGKRLSLCKPRSGLRTLTGMRDR
jgi:hypothetical protein